MKAYGVDGCRSWVPSYILFAADHNVLVTLHSACHFSNSSCTRSTPSSNT